VLFDEQNMAVLEDMVSAALWHLGRRAHAGDLNNACLSYVLVSCGQHAVTMLEGTTCRSVEDLQEFLTWLPLFVFGQMV
jgi:hypothetical protein